MKNFIYSTALLLIAQFGFAQNSIQSNSMQPYIQINTGIGKFDGINFEQIGVAHKRGDFNAFDTDFDLNVLVNGTSSDANAFGFGFSTGYIKTNSNKKWSTGIGLNLNYSKASLTTNLANENNEVVSNINGPNGAEVIEFVDHHYGAGQHIFENKFDFCSYTTSLDLSIIKTFAERTSFHATLGLGLTYLEANNAMSMQLSPAAATPGYETTIDEDGGAVNHFNGNNHAGDLTQSFTGKLGITHPIQEKLMLLLEIQTTRIGAADFNFGSTQYSDHPPTNHWELHKSAHNAHQLSLGFRFVL
jgi:hypothetical protein